MKESRKGSFSIREKLIAFAIILLIGVTAFQTGRMVEAGSTEPGSQSDPLITKSYLDERLGGAKGGFTAVSLTKGETIRLEDGAQLVLMKGSAVISSGTLVNLSEGSTFAKGNSLVMYNSFLAAGVVSVQAKGTVTLYIGGDYSN